MRPGRRASSLGHTAGAARTTSVPYVYCRCWAVKGQDPRSRHDGTSRVAQGSPGPQPPSLVSARGVRRPRRLWLACAISDCVLAKTAKGQDFRASLNACCDEWITYVSMCCLSESH